MGGKGAERGSLDQRFGVCHISFSFRESLNGFFLLDCFFADARIDGGWGKLPILEHVWLTPQFLLMQQGISLSEIVAGRGVLSPWSSQESSDSVELLVPER